jgi:NADP-dependent 3-hydroxy acid dehydrogenase YdfG
MGALERRTAIITRAASGIGAAIADVLAREGAQLLPADRDADGLAALEPLHAVGWSRVRGLTLDGGARGAVTWIERRDRDA